MYTRLSGIIATFIYHALLVLLFGTGSRLLLCAPLNILIAPAPPPLAAPFDLRPTGYRCFILYCFLLSAADIDDAAGPLFDRLLLTDDDLLVKEGAPVPAPFLLLVPVFDLLLFIDEPKLFNEPL